MAIFFNCAADRTADGEAGVLWRLGRLPGRQRGATVGFFFRKTKSIFYCFIIPFLIQLGVGPPRPLLPTAGCPDRHRKPRRGLRLPQPPRHLHHDPALRAVHPGQDGQRRVHKVLLFLLAAAPAAAQEEEEVGTMTIKQITFRIKSIPRSEQIKNSVPSE